MNLSLRSYDPDPAFMAELKSFVRESMAAYDRATMLDFRFLEYNLLAAGWMAAHAGDLDTARAVIAKAGDKADASGYPANRDMARVLRAEIALAEARPGDAIELLEPRLRDDNVSYFLHAVLVRAYLDGDRPTEARHEADWLVANRGLSYGEFNGLKAWQPVNVLESNLALLSAKRASSQAGDGAAAGKYGREFAVAWKNASGARVIARR